MSLETKVGGRFVLMKKLGQGSFGDIYLGRDSDKTPVAMKLEAIRARHLQLAHEYRVLSSLNSGLGIPSVRWYGKEGDYRVLIMDLLGSDLEDLRLKCASRRFSLKTVLMLADQMISRLEYIHSKHYLHRDIKPENFLMGLSPNDHLVYAIDFGLSKNYRDPRTLRHVPYREDCCLEGTARYASVNTHLGFEQSRRDDLESLGYVLIYLLRGSLPWQGLAGKTKAEKYGAIFAKKMETSVDVLTRGLPPEFATYMTYCIDLTFTAEPNYLMLRRLFREAMTREGFEFDYMYDWVKHKPDVVPPPPHIPPLPEVSIPHLLTPPPPPVNHLSSSVSSEDREVNFHNLHADEQPPKEETGDQTAPKEEIIEVVDITPPEERRLTYENSESKLASDTKLLRLEDTVEYAVSDMEETNSEQLTQSEPVNNGSSDSGSNDPTAQSEDISPLPPQNDTPSSPPSPISRRGSCDVVSRRASESTFSSRRESVVSQTESMPPPTQQDESQDQEQHVIQISEPPDQSSSTPQTPPPPPPPTGGRSSMSSLLRAQHKVTPLPRVSPRYSAHSATSKTLAVFGGRLPSLSGSLSGPLNGSTTATSSSSSSTSSSSTPMTSSTSFAPPPPDSKSLRSPSRLPAPTATTIRRISAGGEKQDIKPWQQARSPGRKDSKKGAPPSSIAATASSATTVSPTPKA